MGRVVAWFEPFLRLPFQIVLVGGSLILVYQLARWAEVPGVAGLAGLSLGDAAGPGTVVLLLLVVGLGAAAFLWWLTSRYFRLLGDRDVDPERLAGMRDLPMGLPEGTVRALLAIVVAVVGLPLLLLSQGVDAEIAGYLNGIITGVFGFYFGTRAVGVPTQAVKAISDAEAQAKTLSAQAIQAAETARAAEAGARATQEEAGARMGEMRAQVAALEGRVEDVAGFDGTVARVERQLGLARAIIGTFGPALPPGLVPAGAADLVARAERAVAAVRGIRAAETTPDQAKAVLDALAAVAGRDGPLASLVGRALPLVDGAAGLAGRLPLPGIGPLGALGLLLGVGVRLGASQFQRWRARVLAAPLAQGLVEFGSLTPELVHAALRRSPLLRDALAGQDPAAVDALLANLVLSEEGDEELLRRFGPGAGNLVAGPEEALRGLDQLRQSLLALYGAADVTDEVTRAAAAALAASPNPALAAEGPALAAARPEDVNRLVDALSLASAEGGAPLEARAAFDALVSLVDVARRQQIDLAAAIAELQP